MNKILRCLGAAAGLMLAASPAQALDAAATITALRMAGTVTGGMMPTTAPEFAQMVAAIQAGNNLQAAQIAANSNYAASYLLRRLAFQMQNPALDATKVTDNDATTFIIAHLTRSAGAQGGLSTIWSENATYTINVSRTDGNGVTSTVAVHGGDLTAADLATLNWSTALVRTDGQNAKFIDTANNNTPTPIAIPAKHVGGYTTLNDRKNDNSFAMFGATSGTNLRMIEGIWTISTGLQLLDFASTTARVQDVPRFIPEYDPNFFKGQGQNACISCHGGGVSSLNHGYSAVADLFDFDPNNGLIYISAPTQATMKSLASDPGKRRNNATCNLNRTPTAVCNPDSLGADPNQAWDVSVTWAGNGMLDKLGWNGPTSGQGLNELGTAIGKAEIVYENFTLRVINEVCPTGIFTEDDLTRIANAGKASDDIRTIIAEVASSKTCL